MERIFDRVHKYNDSGHRVLGIASTTADLTGLTNTERPLEEILHGLKLVFDGILVFYDPLREDAATAVKELQSLGVQVKILTGDSAHASMRICSDLGICSGE
jgi:P-type Mg2+ transporter